MTTESFHIDAGGTMTVTKAGQSETRTPPTPLLGMGAVKPHDE